MAEVRSIQMGKEKPAQRLLIFVIAYHAESTLKSVLQRIPREIFSQLDCEILVVDDGSTDRTFAIGHEYKAAHPEIRMTVLRNEYNQGYGGNQKIGYTYAIKEGFDFVAMLHGDGQYAPEKLPDLMQPFREGRADAVFGSRMLSRFGALRGGMPFYKFIGNRILTTAQNLLLGTQLSEFHSGYRIYSVAALKELQFRLNSNNFHFDTEIIIQLLNAKKRIVELPIPTYYGDEISRVEGMKYAKNVMWATVRNAFHRAGVLYQRRFDTQAAGNEHYDLKLGYDSSHTYAIDAVPAGAAVLDLGSGPAGVAAELLSKGCRPAVVDKYRPPRDNPEIPVVVQDLDDPINFDVDGYSHVLMLDIIEHLKDPEQFLDRLRARFDHTPRTIILTTPNIGFVVQRLMLLVGEFNYGKQGILDRTHTRLFTFRGTRHLLRDCGFRIKRMRGIPAPFPKVIKNPLLGAAAVKLNTLLIKLSPTLFSYQIFVEAESTPDLDFLLDDAKKRSAERVSHLRLAGTDD